MLQTFVSDASLVSAAGFSKHSSDIIRGQCHTKFLHGLLKLLLIYVTVAVFVKYLAVTHFRQKLKTNLPPTVLFLDLLQSPVFRVSLFCC